MIKGREIPSKNRLVKEESRWKGNHGEGIFFSTTLKMYSHDVIAVGAKSCIS